MAACRVELVAFPSAEAQFRTRFADDEQSHADRARAEIAGTAIRPTVAEKSIQRALWITA
jgi:demethoxyubiquinone hydroxylase (CLK1/Coq7/Cat5 family)